MNNSTRPKRSKLSATIITIIVCAALAMGSVAISIFDPSSGFDFIPSGLKPGEVHYSDMEYVRPDANALTEDIAHLIELITSEKSFTDQSRLFTSINKDLANFRTMASLAEIRYYTDTTDEFYKEENKLLGDEYIGIYDKICELLDTIADSKFKNNYERSFFGIGYFKDWEPMDKSDAVTELLKKEQALIAEYQEELSNPSFTVDINDIGVLATIDSINQIDPTEILIQKYNERLGGIYVKIVKTRLELAKELGTDYISYAYKNLDRDYTPEEANAYMNGIIEHVLPVISNINADDSVLNTPADTITSFYHLSLAAGKMGDIISGAFDHMSKYGLYEVAVSQNKLGISFEIFLEKYNSPFMFVSSTGRANDLLTYAHEFGHFVDDYVNFGQSATVDSAEISSQAMAYILPFYSSGMGKISGEDFLKANLYSTFEMYIYSAFVNNFETAVYSLSPEEVTLEKINELAKKAALDAGLTEEMADILGLSWFEIQHVYIAPMYYVSYAISNDVALQILEAELKKPLEGGVEAFEKLIKKNTDLTLPESIERIGFESPFEDGRAEKIAALIGEIFEIEDESLAPAA